MVDMVDSIKVIIQTALAQNAKPACNLGDIVARAHPLAGRASADPDALRGHAMIRFSHLHEGTPDQEACLFAQPLVAPEPVVDSAALMTTCALAAAGVGFALSHSLALHLFRDAGLRALPFAPRSRCNRLRLALRRQPLSGRASR